MRKTERRGGSLLGFFTRCAALIGGEASSTPHPHLALALDLGLTYPYPCPYPSPFPLGLFTVAGIVDASLYHSSKKLRKMQEGRQD